MQKPDPLQTHRVGPVQFREWRFLQLSLLIIFFMFISPFLGKNWAFHILVQVIMLNSVLVTLSATSAWPRIRRALWALWALAAIGSLAGFLPGISALYTLGAALETGCLALLLIGCIVCILSFVFHNLRATPDSIFAALCAYLLLALAFSLIFMLVHLFDPGSFKLPGHPADAPFETIRLDMIYFSFVTIATLGYGDIVPKTSFARLLTVIEAVLGQFYVAVVLAMLVGSLIAKSQSPGDTRQ